MERRFKIEGKEITLELKVVKDIPPYLIVRVKADDDTLREVLQRYVGDGSFEFAIYIEDIFSALKESLTEVNRD
jgi:hypothetical protein